MSLGLGKRYWVRMLKCHFGDLDSCLQFMNENKPKNEKEWFELDPLPKVVKGKAVSCKEYRASLVTDADRGK